MDRSKKITMSPRKQHVLVTITPYTEQEKRVTNGTSGGPPPPPLPAPIQSPTAKSPEEDAVEMQSIESFKLKESPSPLIPKPPSTYFSLSNSGSNSPTSSAGSPRHAISPAKSTSNQSVNSTGNNNNNNNNNNNHNNNLNRTTTDEKTSSPPVGKVPPAVPVSSFGPGKIAVRIGAYEGEAKQPSRLDFLPQTPPRVAELPSAKIIPEEIVDGPVVSRLQNELAATLQRSNLRKKTETENNTAVKQIPECPVVPIRNSSTELENGGISLLQSNVEKLAAALSNRVTIKVNPENGSR